MTTSPLTKVVLPAATLAGAVFLGLTAPLALYGSETIEIQFRDETVYAGKLREVAGGYIGLAALLGIGVGTTLTSLAGWRAASGRADSSDQLVESLQQNLSEKSLEVEQLLIASPQLSSAGLDGFLHESDPSISVPRTAAAMVASAQRAGSQLLLEPAPIAVAQATYASAHVPAQALSHPGAQAAPTWQACESLAAAPQADLTEVSPAKPLSVYPMPSAQTYVGLSWAKQPPAAPSPLAGQMAGQQASPLQEQLNQIMQQIEALQVSLQTVQPATDVSSIEPAPVGNAVRTSQRSAAMAIAASAERSFDQAVSGYAVGTTYRVPSKEAWVARRLAS